MSKKPKAKKKNHLKPEQRSQGDQKEAVQPNEGNNSVDLGGMPDRDLKKNLGCG